MRTVQGQQRSDRSLGNILLMATILLFQISCTQAATQYQKPYSSNHTERESIFAFTQKPQTRFLGNDKYEITFSLKGYCDVTVGIINNKGKVIRHLAAGVLGKNAPAPFQKRSLKQTIHWNGKDDLGQYIRNPSAFRVKVMLGMNPTFDKRLGGTSPKNIPGCVFGLAVGEKGAFVFGRSRQVTVRKFDHDGNYLKSIVPPPANLPHAKLTGMGFVEYEKGKRAIHPPKVNANLSGFPVTLPGANAAMTQPVLIGSRILYLSMGSTAPQSKTEGRCHYIYTDGSTDQLGLTGYDLGTRRHSEPRLAASPDGKWVYMTGINPSKIAPVVMRFAADGTGKATTFIGDPKKPGAGKQQLNNPRGIDVDAQGRIYVADTLNNRVQIYSPEGKHLKSIPVTNPNLVRVHLKSGAIYVLHRHRGKGRSRSRLSEYHSWSDPRVLSHQDGIDAHACALDSWSTKPRLWVGGAGLRPASGKPPRGGGRGVEIWEKAGAGWKKIVDFDADAKKEAGENYVGRFEGGHDGKGNNRVTCDASRDQVCYRKSDKPGTTFDLKSGNLLGQWKTKNWLNGDVAFDRRGYMHLHGKMGRKYIYRVDPDRKTKVTPTNNSQNVWFYPEVPYNYGVACHDLGTRNFYTAGDKGEHLFKGGLPVIDQYYVDGNEHGLGVNMRGDIVAHATVVYVPKMADVTKTATMQAFSDNSANGIRGSDQTFRFDSIFKRYVQEMTKRGESVYYIKKRPGIPLTGGTLWTWDSTGELRQECAAIIQYNINGCMMDEDNKLYFLAPGPRIFNPEDGHFLAGSGGTFGMPGDKSNRTFFTGTVMKTREVDAKMLMACAKIPLHPLPSRTPDLTIYSGNQAKKGWTWMDGAEWLYAGIGPIKSSGCQCPSSRLHLDWYKRTYAPEGYRHSFAALDTAGNLITHIGSYGNFDSISGPKSKIPVGGDNIGMFECRFMTGTDNYLVYEAWGEGVVVLKINYHAEEIVAIQAKE